MENNKITIIIMSKSEFPKFYNTKKRHFLDVWKLINFQAMSRILYLLGYISSYLWNKRVGLKICKIQFNFKVYDSYIYVYVYMCKFLSIIYYEIICSKWTLNMKGNECSKTESRKEISHFRKESRKVEWGNKSYF